MQVSYAPRANLYRLSLLVAPGYAKRDRNLLAYQTLVVHAKLMIKTIPMRKDRLKRVTKTSLLHRL